MLVPSMLVLVAGGGWWWSRLGRGVWAGGRWRRACARVERAALLATTHGTGHTAICGCGCNV
eukprot:scaffold3871_cov97-Isochrysis_galbana.AAC.5